MNELTQQPNIEFRQTFYENARLIITRCGIHLFILTLFTTTFEQELTNMIHQELLSQSGVGPMLWVSIFASTLLSLVYPITAMTLILSAFVSNSVIKTSLQYIQQQLIENIRSIGSSMTWGLLFIIPGLIKYLGYTFVPFIVMFDPHYQVGKVDALEKSRKLVKKKFWKIFLLFTLTTFIVPLFLSIFDEQSLVTKHFFSATALIVVEVFIIIIFNLVLLNTWRKTNESYI